MTDQRAWAPPGGPVTAPPGAAGLDGHDEEIFNPLLHFFLVGESHRLSTTHEKKGQSSGASATARSQGRPHVSRCRSDHDDAGSSLLRLQVRASPDHGALTQDHRFLDHIPSDE